MSISKEEHVWVHDGDFSELCTQHGETRDIDPTIGLSPHDTVLVATYNRMVRKRDKAVALAGTYLRTIHAAPHGHMCEVAMSYGTKCCCWKAGL